MSLFGNSSNIYFNGSSATKVFLNGNVVWSLITETPPPTPTPTSSNNLMLYFDPSDVASYSGTGTTINDLSGNGLNGTMSNITFTSPYFTYNGSTSQVSIADNSLLEPGSGEFTMEVWFYKTSTSGSSVILGKFDNGGGSEDVSYSIRTNNTALFAQLGDGTGGVLNVDYVNSTSYTFSANTWYHVVYVWKPGVSLETFINGTSIGTISTTMSSILNSTNPLYLGRYNGGEFVQNFAGRIGIVRLHNTALTSSDVLDSYNNDILKYTEPTPTPTPTPTPSSTNIPTPTPTPTPSSTESEIGFSGSTGTEVDFTLNTLFDAYSSRSGVTSTDAFNTNNGCWQLYYAHENITIKSGTNTIGLNTYNSGSNTWTWYYAVSNSTDTIGDWGSVQTLASSKSYNYTTGNLSLTNITGDVVIPAGKYFLIANSGGPFYRTIKSLSENRTAMVSSIPYLTSINQVCLGNWPTGGTTSIPSQFGGTGINYTLYNGYSHVHSVTFA
jgi:hypothetical protein